MELSSTITTLPLPAGDCEGSAMENLAWSGVRRTYLRKTGPVRREGTGVGPPAVQNPARQNGRRGCSQINRGARI